MTVKSRFLENGLCFQKFLNRFEGLWKYWFLNHNHPSNGWFDQGL